MRKIAVLLVGLVLMGSAVGQTWQKIGSSNKIFSPKDPTEGATISVNYSIPGTFLFSATSYARINNGKVELREVRNTGDTGYSVIPFPYITTENFSNCAGTIQKITKIDQYGLTVSFSGVTASFSCGQVIYTPTSVFASWP